MSDMGPDGSGELRMEPGEPAVGAYVPDLPDTATEPLPPLVTGVPAGKPKTSVLFLLLGLAAPFVLTTLVSTAFNSVEWGSIVMYALFGVVLLGNLAMLLIGRSRGNVALASFGKGGLWSYAVIALLLLAAFGTCLVSGFVASGN